MLILFRTCLYVEISKKIYASTSNFDRKRKETEIVDNIQDKRAF